MKQTLRASHSVVSLASFSIAATFHSVFFNNRTTGHAVFNSVGGTSFQPCVSARWARDEDPNSNATDDDDDIADDDADDVAHV